MTIKGDFSALKQEKFDKLTELIDWEITEYLQKFAQNCMQKWVISQQQTRLLNSGRITQTEKYRNQWQALFLTGRIAFEGNQVFFGRYLGENKGWDKSPACNHNSNLVLMYISTYYILPKDHFQEIKFWILCYDCLNRIKMWENQGGPGVSSSTWYTTPGQDNSTSSPTTPVVFRLSKDEMDQRSVWIWSLPI